MSPGRYQSEANRASGARSADPGGGLFSVANTGAIVYVMLAPRRHQPRWIGHAGQPLGLAGDREATTRRLSPDRRKLVAGRAADDAGTIGLWVFDFERNLNSRVPLGGRASSASGRRTGAAWPSRGRRVKASERLRGGSQCLRGGPKRAAGRSDSLAARLVA